MVKIAFWDQKSSFFQSYYKCSYGRYMAGNMHLGCPRHILRAFLIYGSDLVHFWKNRKKSIFWLIFCDLRSYIYLLNIYVWNGTMKMKKIRGTTKKSQKYGFFQNEMTFNPYDYKWKDATWRVCFALKKVLTILSRWPL